MPEKEYQFVKLSVTHPNGRTLHCYIPLGEYTNAETLGNAFKNMKWVFDKDDDAYVKWLKQEEESKRRLAEHRELHKKLGNA